MVRDNQKKKNVLVTGSHRSGTTWTAIVLAQANKTRYINEPFNLNIPRINSPISYWFEYIDKIHTPPKLQNSYEQYLKSFYNLEAKKRFKEILNVRNYNDLHFCLADVKNRILSKKSIFKDPIAVLSAEWFFEVMDSDILITIRHPAAFVASLINKGWRFDFNNLYAQKKLMDGHFRQYEKTIAQYRQNPPPIIYQGILLWKLIYYTVHIYERKYKNKWLFVKHENLSLNPIEEFKKIFNFLSLDFNTATKNFITKSTTSNVDTELKRNSITNIKAWKERLSSKEILLIKKETKSIWPLFYSETDW